MSDYADPSVEVQRSWQGLAGTTGEQMRTVGVRFNLEQRYRMQSAAVPGKDGMNFSHCASDSSFQWVESRGKKKNKVFRILCFFPQGLFKLTNTQIYVHTGLSLLLPASDSNTRDTH